MEFVELLERFDIEVAPDTHHHTTHGWIQFDCPFCGRGSQSYHMGYNITYGYVNCWKCGRHNLFMVLREYSRESSKTIKKYIDALDATQQPIQREYTNTATKLPTRIGPLTDAHIHYLNKRGFDHKEIQRLWGVQGIGMAARLSWRLFIPVLHHGIIASWTTRSLKDEGQRYISAKPEQELLPHKNLLYGGDYVRNSVVIVEGPIDAWAVGPGAVALFGTAYTRPQLCQLINIPKRIVCFDSSPDAQEQADKLCNELGPFDGRTINVQLDADDPGSAKRKEIAKLRKLMEN